MYSRLPRRLGGKPRKGRDDQSAEPNNHSDVSKELMATENQIAANVETPAEVPSPD